MILIIKTSIIIIIAKTITSIIIIINGHFVCSASSVSDLQGFYYFSTHVFILCRLNPACRVLKCPLDVDMSSSTGAELEEFTETEVHIRADQLKPDEPVEPVSTRI